MTHISLTMARTSIEATLLRTAGPLAMSEIKSVARRTVDGGKTVSVARIACLEAAYERTFV